MMARRSLLLSLLIPPTRRRLRFGLLQESVVKICDERRQRFRWEERLVCLDILEALPRRQRFLPLRLRIRGVEEEQEEEGEEEERA
jgi:hypothetical protein